MKASPYSQPNLYTLSGGDLHITYFGPQAALPVPPGDEYFVYQDLRETLVFRGKEIQNVETALGLVVSVNIRRSVDRGSVTFSLMVPRVNVPGEMAVPVKTVGITAMHHFSIVPLFNQGQQDFYTITQLEGSASRVLEPLAQ